MKVSKLLEKVKNSLVLVANNADDNFTGTSIAVCKSFDNIPYVQMSPSNIFNENLELHDNLIRLSSINNLYHDGFHLLSDKLQFSYTSCYLSPKISKNKSEEISFLGKGSRFATAYFSSLLEDVICTGIINCERRVIIFIKGKAYYDSN